MGGNLRCQRSLVYATSNKRICATGQGTDNIISKREPKSSPHG
jgi:hypothetical protein